MQLSSHCTNRSDAIFPSLYQKKALEHNIWYQSSFSLLQRSESHQPQHQDQVRANMKARWQNSVPLNGNLTYHCEFCETKQSRTCNPLHKTHSEWSIRTPVNWVLNLFHLLKCFHGTRRPQETDSCLQNMVNASILLEPHLSFMTRQSIVCVCMCIWVYKYVCVYRDWDKRERGGGKEGDRQQIDR